MIYCDLSLSGTPIWTGAPCLWAVPIRSWAAPGLVGGRLMFYDSQGSSDPTWDGLGSRYQLLWLPNQITASNQVSIIPLQAVPSQQLDVTLGALSYTITVYDNSPS